nr:AMP-binding protein [uncultured Duganella sp.]
MDWNRANTFGDLVDLAVTAYGSKDALRDQRRTLTYQGYADEIAQIASVLSSMGVRCGDRVAILSQNRVEVPVLLGLSRYGFVPVPLNWRLPAEDLGALLRDCEPAALFVEDRYRATLDYLATLEQLPERAAALLVTIGKAEPGQRSYDEMLRQPRASLPAASSAHDPACIIYTSGTTGAPKGAVLTQAGVAINCRDLAREGIRFTASDLSLLVMPLFHVGGIWYYMFPSLFAGATVILQERFDPDMVVAGFASDPVTNLHVVPTMLADLLNRPAFAVAARQLRLIVYAGSSMPLDLLQRAMNTLEACEFSQAYGSTEAGSITTLDAQAHRLAAADPSRRQLLRSCGKPFAATEVRIEQTAGDADPVGEILVRSRKLMAGYWRLPAATAERMTDDGWFRTGDLGYLDKDGYLYIVDRKNDMVISGGENIFPFEVEEVLYSHPLIEEASVFGVPDARWVERLVAAVVLTPGAALTGDDVIDYARTHLPGYKTPKTVHIVEVLPKSAVGKVLRKNLRERFQAG